MNAACVNLNANDSQELELLRLYRLMTREQQVAVVNVLFSMCASAPVADAIARAGL